MSPTTFILNSSCILALPVLLLLLHVHAACLLALHHDVKIAIKRELGLLWNSLLDYTYQSSSISKAVPTFKDTPISACSTGMKAIPAISDHASKGHLSGKLRPLSLPKPTIILPFSHSKTMTILKDGHMKPVTLLCIACLHAYAGARSSIYIPDTYSSQPCTIVSNNIITL